jgi:hypothetical protein
MGGGEGGKTVLPPNCHLRLPEGSQDAIDTFCRFLLRAVCDWLPEPAAPKCFNAP